MHILYVHKAFPPQFAPMAKALAQIKGWRATFLSRKPDQIVEGLENIQYDAKENEQKQWDQTFHEGLRHAAGVANALRRRPSLQPDLVVAHSGFGSSVFIPTVRDCPIVNYFEYYTHPLSNDLLFRREWKHEDWYYCWRRVANAMTLLDLQTCKHGYAPTRWQRSTFPAEFQDKIDVLFDGVDTAAFCPRPETPSRQILGHIIPEDVQVITYVARGFELVRGFDIFMKLAKRIYTERPNTVFLVAGKDRVCYGTDLSLTKAASFKQWVLEQDDYDLSKFIFLGWTPVEDLPGLFHLSDFHIYLTVPFVLSWSLFNAMACGTTVLASDVAPVREIVKDGENGLLCDFYDLDAMTERALEVLDDPAKFAPLGRAAIQLMESRYSLRVMLPKFIRYFEDIAKGG